MSAHTLSSSNDTVTGSRSQSQQGTASASRTDMAAARLSLASPIAPGDDPLRRDGNNDRVNIALGLDSDSDADYATDGDDSDMGSDGSDGVYDTVPLDTAGTTKPAHGAKRGRGDTVAVLGMMPSFVQPSAYTPLTSGGGGSGLATYNTAGTRSAGAGEIKSLSVWTSIEPKLGMIYMILSTVAFCAMGMSVKAIAMGDERVPTLEVVVLRSLIGALCSSWLVWYGGINGGLLAPPHMRSLLVVRGVLGFVGLSLGFWTLTILTVADATVIGFLAPVFTGLFGRIVLNETWEAMDAAAGFVSLGGVLLIARPKFLFGSTFSGVPDDVLGLPDEIIPPDSVYDDMGGSVLEGINGAISAAATNMSRFISSQTTDSQTSSSSSSRFDAPMKPSAVYTAMSLFRRDNGTVSIPKPIHAPISDATRLTGVLAGLLSAVFVASAIISIRKLASKGAHAYHIINYFHVISIMLCVPLAPLLPESIEPHRWIMPSHLHTWILLTSTALTGVAGQLLQNWGLARESAARASTMTYAQAVVAFFAEWIVWGVVPHWMSLLGGLVVVACVAFVAFFKKPASSPTAKDAESGGKQYKMVSGSASVSMDNLVMRSNLVQETQGDSGLASPFGRSRM
ncbi:hypothetical protein BC831DRAFT_513565 [Entophlyctis helioformis]|nr:hypothetical protein BC831DRAFT_513565 [Entophlyctis helioformis]